MATRDQNADPRRAPEPYTVQQQARRTHEWDSACSDIVEMKTDLHANFPELSVAEIDVFMATLIIRNNLGEDWVLKHIDKQGGRSHVGHYLRSQPTDALEQHEHYVRVMELARRIFELGQERFIERLLENLGRRDLEGAAFEADVVRMLLSAPFIVDLRAERGTKGDDYDIDLWLHPDRCWSIEVKTRAEDAPFTKKALRRTLERARTQLPVGGSSAIFLKVPTPWLDDEDYLEMHPAVVFDFLRNTSRVQSVVLVWDMWSPKASGRGLDWKREFRVVRAVGIGSVESHMLDFYEKIWSETWNIGPIAPF